MSETISSRTRSPLFRFIISISALVCLHPVITPDAGASDRVLRIFKDRQLKNEVAIMSHHGIRISDSPSCKTGKCQAVRAIDAGRSPPASASPLSGARRRFVISPASRFCQQHEGLPAIYFYGNRDEVSICEFKDGSFLLPWDILNGH